MTTTTSTTGSNLDCCTPVAAESESTSHHPASSCCSPSGDQTRTTGALEDVKAHEVEPEVAALWVAGFRLLLDHGRPVELDHWADEAGIDATTIPEVLERSAGRVQLDQQGRLIGLAGLTIEPTSHQFDIDGTRRWTWCALDAVGILGALQATGSIRSTDPGTGDAVTIDFERGQPQEDPAIFILNGYDGGNIRDEWCPLVNFFNSRDDAELWVKDNDLSGDILSVHEVIDEASSMWRTVTDPVTAR